MHARELFRHLLQAHEQHVQVFNDYVGAKGLSEADTVDFFLTHGFLPLPVISNPCARGRNNSRERTCDLPPLDDEVHLTCT